MKRIVKTALAQRGHQTDLARTTSRKITWLALAAAAVMLGQNPSLAQYLQLNLTGFQDGMGRYTDSKLNGWGMVQTPEGPFCVADSATGVATFYNRSGKPLPTTITIPAASGAGQGVPSGLVYNSTDDFVISKNGKSAPARLIFSTLDGAICGWNPAVDHDNAILMFSGAGAGYPGLALGKNSHGRNMLYAANWGAPPFQNVGFDMFDGGFNLVGSFADPAVATEFSAYAPFPFGIDYEGGKLWVTYGMVMSVPLTFGGVVDVFDADGNLLTPHHFAANAPGGPLANPWAFAMAPAHFEKFSNALLIGNVEGPGYINAFDPNTGSFLGQLTNPDGDLIAIPGLWEMIFPHDNPGNGKSNPLFFDAGPNAITFSGNGTFGMILPAGD
jgi:uncharacterized protein (TIGR03118 family)